MPVKSNLHTHTHYSDGIGTPEAYAKKALALGFQSLGFSEHAEAHYDAVAIQKHRIGSYISEINALKQKYRDQLEIYLGFEGDYFAPVDKKALGLDFVIGSVHYVKNHETGDYHALDSTRESFEQAVIAFGGIQWLVAEYYRLVGNTAITIKPDIIGHFDLITKLNKDGRYFDPTASWYLAAAYGALEKVAASGCIAEVNTGAMARGYTCSPYPSSEILQFMFDLGIPLTIASDAHSVNTLDYGFHETADMLKSMGFQSVLELSGGKFTETAL